MSPYLTKLDNYVLQRAEVITSVKKLATVLLNRLAQSSGKFHIVSKFVYALKCLWLNLIASYVICLYNIPNEIISHWQFDDNMNEFYYIIIIQLNNNGYIVTQL